MIGTTVTHRRYVANSHYAGNLVDGAYALGLFGDAATELCIRTDGDEGLFAGYEKVEFLAPLYGGDFVRATGTIVRMGNTSRTVDLEIWKEISARPDVSDSAADLLPEPILATRASNATPRERAPMRVRVAVASMTSPACTGAWKSTRV